MTAHRRVFRRGEVWTAELGGKHRPVVIVTHDALCAVLARLTIAGVTTTRRGVRTEVELGEHNGVAEGSVVNALYLATLSASGLSVRRGQLDLGQIRALDGALRLALGLEDS